MSTATLSFQSTSSPVAGFGEYQNFFPADFSASQTAGKMQLLVQSILLGTASIAVIAATAVFPPFLFAASFTLGSFAVFSVSTFLKYRASLTYFPPELTSALNPHNFYAKRVGEYIQENGPGVVLNNSIETQKYKLDLIRSAQQSIFFSCYMGEEALDETLDLIKERMEQKKDLKVFILGSQHFITPANKKRLEHLQVLHPNRFFYVLNPEMYYSEHPSSGRSLLCTNHIKLMTIDQGAYMITGGSALRPYWTKVTGNNHLPKLKPSWFDLYNPLEAKGFRDMDFAFKSYQLGSGTTAFLEGAKLMLRYAHMQSPKYAQQLKGHFLKLMKTPRSSPLVPSIDTHPQRVDGMGMKLYATGPDHVKNSYLHALIDLINNAKDKIVIGQMFFHPPQSLLSALKNASKRGIKIKIITNFKGKEAPPAHRFFSDMGQTKYQQLFDGKGQQNVKVYQFYRANTTYHKKIVVVDDQYTALGSSNFGTKSMEENPADYEFNTIVDSRAFAGKTIDVLNDDIALSHEVLPQNAKSPSWDTKVLAPFQEQLMTHFL